VDTVHECDRQTDRQTDGQTDRITIPKTVQRRASHGKNAIDRSTMHGISTVTELLVIIFLTKVRAPASTGQMQRSDDRLEDTECTTALLIDKMMTRGDDLFGKVGGGAFQCRR